MYLRGFCALLVFLFLVEEENSVGNVGNVTKSNSYTFQKNSIWYFSRRVPTDLRRHYRTGRIAYSLRTRSHTTLGY